MLDLKAIVDEPERSAEALKRRDPGLSLTALLALARQRHGAVVDYEVLRARQRSVSTDFAKRDMAPEARAKLREDLKILSGRVKAHEERMKALDSELGAALLVVPNLPDPRVPDGRTDADNVVVRTWGERPRFDFEPQEHDVLGETLGILDFEAARKLSGARFVLYRGLGAKLERSLASFMLDLHVTRHGYIEILPPYLVSRETMTGTGQLPKFEDDAFRTEPDDLFLIPTAEVPVTNIHRGEILDADTLPRRYVAYSSCFRREAGSYGKDTRGLTRLHQFQKVELVQFTRPDASEAAHAALTGHAEAVLRALGLPYRVVELCAGDLGFSARRCYDLEVWLAGQGAWREISSCSNFGDFQARRANIRYRAKARSKPAYVHTLNGSGLAIGRTVMALLEHYQREDGSVLIPEVLRSYMGVDRISAN